MIGSDVLPLSPVEKIPFDHDIESFDCGYPELNRFLQRYAIVNQKVGTVQTYVACRGSRVVGYYSLAAGSMAHRDVPERVGQYLARHRVPLMILARLAVDVHEQGTGLGAALLKDAMLRTVHAAEILGIRAIFVHAKDENAKSFYERSNYKSSPTDPHHLYCLVKDIKRLTGS
jgi:GNAT superfamily N-acetyltransferase